MKMNKLTNNKNFRVLLIITIIALLTNCNQTKTEPSVATTNLEANKPTASDESYFSRKGYQNKFTRWFKPYRIDIQQGNLITEEMVNDIKIGMSKEQIKHVLGTSVLTESFNQDKWIYAYSNATKGKLQKEQVLVLSFKNDRLNDIKENIIINS
jgi:outer membrane protein assembly factor BamE (lipoprotein component of BamABCDE complex)